MAERELLRCTQEWKASNRDDIARRERRYLPGPFGYLNILFRLPRKLRTDDERALMRTAHRFYGFWGSVFGAVLLGSVVLGLSLWNVSQNEKATGLVDSLVQAPPQAVELALQNLSPLHDRATARLEYYFRGADFESWQKLHAAYALAEIAGPQQDDAFKFVFNQIAEGPTDECRNMVRTLTERKKWALDEMERQFGKADLDAKVRYATVALHFYHRPADPTLFGGL